MISESLKSKVYYRTNSGTLPVLMCDYVKISVSVFLLFCFYKLSLSGFSAVMMDGLRPFSVSYYLVKLPRTLCKISAIASS